MIELKNLATYRRYLLKETNLLVVVGGIDPVMSGMHVYNSRHHIEGPSAEMNSMIRELLASVGLAAVSLSDRESWGWSLTFEGLRLGFFVGAEPEGMLCLRAKEAAPERSVAMIQRQKPGDHLTQSHLQPKWNGPAKIVQQYFLETVQTATRLAVGEDGRAALIQALPGGDFESVSSFTDEELLDFAGKAVEQSDCQEAGEVVLFYECRCSQEMISKMIGDMKEAERRELWADLNELEIECPRCGREYTLKRTERSEA